ncbi:MAG TPA: excinuclease ABC subunit UvrA [Actinomycetota bacterium]|nr:excinuclease ABC subunit UvrA [Actinomycetota bacterium]
MNEGFGGGGTRTGDHIVIRGARENNLKGVSVDIPKRKITVFTGVSGSGKSSLVFDTIASEAQRQLNETFTAFQRNFFPSYKQPEVEVIENISTAIVIDQKRIGGNSRSTVGTITDINPLIRVMFSRAGKPFVGYSNAFSFNDPSGMCPECQGLGRTMQVRLDKLLDRSRSLNDGAILHPDFKRDNWQWRMYANSGFFDPDKPLEQYSDREWEMFLHGEGKMPLTFAGGEFNATYEGIVRKFNRLYIRKDLNEMSERNRRVFLSFVDAATCPECNGTRLNKAARSCKIDGFDITELLAMEATELGELLRAFSDPLAVSVASGVIERVDNLIGIGLGYLSLSRETSTLSGGESQRIKMVRHLNSSLTDVMYVLDEPSVGLHARDTHHLNRLLRKLRDKGNTVLVVEHDRDVIEIADHIIDLGPQAGPHGGEVVYEGSVEGLYDVDTLTGRFMKHKLPLKDRFRRPQGTLRVENAKANNLKDVTVEFPAGVFTVVTGVAGSGKSSLVNDEFLARHPEAVVIDQSAVGISRRSNAATYTGILDDVRSLFAKANRVSPSLFSFNSKGACPNCQGLGVVYTDLAFMEGYKSPCDVCDGKRFTAEVLTHKLRGRSISDVLNLTAQDALGFFPERRIAKVLQALNDVGLGYLALGQPLNTLSGGECQRLKLATELHKTSSIYVMDEPTTGLHMSDIGHLLAIIDRLVDQGNTVMVIEHDLDVIKNADWIVDLGPGAGSARGQVVFEGTPKDLLDSADSVTAKFVRRDLAVAAPA